MRRGLGLALLVVALFGDAAAAAAPCPPRRGGFRVYQALLYEHMPDLRSRGIARLHVVDRGFWRDGNGPGSAADPARVAAVIAALPHDGAPIAIDIEWPGLHARDAATAGQIRALASIAAQFKTAAAGHPIGYYGVFPLDDYWRAIDIPAGSVAEWQRDDDGAAPINAHVDVTFPSLYTYYRDRAGWVRQAHALVCEARRISGGKPVYAFVWPEYHEFQPGCGNGDPSGLLAASARHAARHRRWDRHLGRGRPAGERPAARMGRARPVVAGHAGDDGEMGARASARASAEGPPAGALALDPAPCAAPRCAPSSQTPRGEPEGRRARPQGEVHGLAH